MRYLWKFLILCRKTNRDGFRNNTKETIRAVERTCTKFKQKKTNLKFYLFAIKFGQFKIKRWLEKNGSIHRGNNLGIAWEIWYNSWEIMKTIFGDLSFNLCQSG